MLLKKSSSPILSPRRADFRVLQTSSERGLDLILKRLTYRVHGQQISILQTKISDNTYHFDYQSQSVTHFDAILIKSASCKQPKAIRTISDFATFYSRLFGRMYLESFAIPKSYFEACNSYPKIVSCLESNILSRL